MKQQATLTDSEIAEVAARVLRHEFEGLGFEGAVVRSEEDFDGPSIIHVAAHATHPVPVERPTEALHKIRPQLVEHGEDRFVFLDALDPHEATPIDEDVE